LQTLWKCGYAHSDIHPGNVVLANDDPERLRVTLIDLGSALRLEPGGSTGNKVRTRAGYVNPKYVGLREGDLLSLATTVLAFARDFTKYNAESEYANFAKNVGDSVNLESAETSLKRVKASLESVEASLLEKIRGSS